MAELPEHERVIGNGDLADPTGTAPCRAGRQEAGKQPSTVRSRRKRYSDWLRQFLTGAGAAKE